jgi:ribosome assembly protein YihI (activator of Der GTPase)
MKKLILLLLLAFLLPYSLVNAQQYTAQEYWKMENDTSYTRLLNRMQAGEVLSAEEQSKLVDYKSRLSA